MARLPKGQGVIPLPPFSAFLASNIPAVYDNTMSYYEELCALLKYLNDQVTPALNSNAEAITILSNYVEHYFDDLDVQEEINNKLDQMAEDGTLQEIIADYLNAQALWCFATVAEMKASTNLIDGSSARTLGYYAIDDGGKALYRVRTVTNDDVVDEGSIIALSDDHLVAELVTDEANVKQFGAYGDNTHNDTTAFQNAANYAQENEKPFYVPEAVYVIDTVTIDKVPDVRINGYINLSDATKTLNIYDDHDLTGNRPYIYINTVRTGKIVMKGIQSADVHIERATHLDLVADNTTGHNAIAFCKFYLGFITTLTIEDDGSGTKYINENLFIGGRYENVNIGTGNSTYHHENNLFLKPLNESTAWTFGYAKANIVKDARFEGTSTITFSSESFANVVNQEWSTVQNGYWSPKDDVRSNITIVDNSNGKNRYYCNEGLEEHVVSINAFHNPNSVPTENGNLKPATSDPWIYQTGKFALPSNKTFALWLKCKNENGVAATGMKLLIRCYDASGNLISTQPTNSLLLNSPTLAWNSGYNGYTNASYGNVNLWGIVTPNATVKYIDVKVRAISGGSQKLYKSFDLYLTSYDQVPQYIVDGFKTSATLS